MRRWSLALFLALAASNMPLRADDFDYYTNKVLAKVPEAKGVSKLEKLTPQLLAEHAAMLKGSTGTLIVVKTNEGRWSKLLVYPAQQKITDDKKLPILLISRFVTYKEGEDRAILVQGQNVHLFNGFVFNLDLGQVVPADVGGDIRFVVGQNGAHAEPIGKAEIYLLTKPLPEAKPDTSPNLVVGPKFLAGYFNGVYKLHDDGRRSGTLHLSVNGEGVVKGHFFSDKDGKKYDVEGKVSEPNHKIQFKIFYPKTVQHFQGWMFTGDAKAFTGWSKMENQETGFYAVRLEAKAENNP
jgi:hypothetical protein